MSEIQDLLENFSQSVQFSEVSGFEVLELLDVRSRLAALEPELSPSQRMQLEEADGVFLRNAPAFYASISEVGDLPELRQRAAARCSHWWWYLEKLATPPPRPVAV